MTERTYLNFDLIIEKVGEKYRARVVDSPAGESRAEFETPFSALELENLILRMGRQRSGARRIESSEMETVKTFGSRLFRTVFTEDVYACFLRSMDAALKNDKGLRVRLRIDAPEFQEFPWEFLYNAQLNQFLALSKDTPLVRYMDLPYPVEALPLEPPLKILAMISSPAEYPPLDVEKEWAALNKALKPLIDSGLVSLERLERPTLLALQQRLRRGDVHIFHFIGHGKYFEQKQDGMLLLEDENGRGKPVSGLYLGTILHDHHSLRLVVLNACEGARTSMDDPYAGVAQTLVRQGIPAVIAMQFEIYEAAALTFAQEFYCAIADGYPVDTALSEARKAVFANTNDVEWGTPVLFTRISDGILFKRLSLDPDAAARLAREKEERELAEQAARQQAELAAAQKLEAEKKEREVAETAIRQKAEQAAIEKAAREKVEREAAEKAAREQAKREAAERVARGKAEKVALEKARREQAALVMPAPHARNVNRKVLFIVLAGLLVVGILAGGGGLYKLGQRGVGPFANLLIRTQTKTYIQVVSSTPSRTPKPSLSPTSTSTPSPIPASLVPTLPIPTGQLVYEETFSKGSANFIEGNNYKVIDDGTGNMVLRSTGNGRAYFVFGPSNFTKGTIDFRFKPDVDKSTAGIPGNQWGIAVYFPQDYQIDNQSGYLLNIFPQRDSAELDFMNNGNASLLMNGAFQFSANVWYHVRVGYDTTSVRVDINDTRIINSGSDLFVPPPSYLQGSIVIIQQDFCKTATTCPDPAWFEFDDIRVWVP